MDQNQKKPEPFSKEDWDIAYDMLMKRYGNEEQAKRLLARVAKTSGKELPEEYR